MRGLRSLPLLLYLLQWGLRGDAKPSTYNTSVGVASELQRGALGRRGDAPQHLSAKFRRAIQAASHPQNEEFSYRIVSGWRFAGELTFLLALHIVAYVLGILVWRHWLYSDAANHLEVLPGDAARRRAPSSVERDMLRERAARLDGALRRRGKAAERYANPRTYTYRGAEAEEAPPALGPWGRARLLRELTSADEQASAGIETTSCRAFAVSFMFGFALFQLLLLEVLGLLREESLRMVAWNVDLSCTMMLIWIFLPIRLVYCLTRPSFRPDLEECGGEACAEVWAPHRPTPKEWAQHLWTRHRRLVIRLLPVVIGSAIFLPCLWAFFYYVSCYLCAQETPGAPVLHALRRPRRAPALVNTEAGLGQRLASLFWSDWFRARAEPAFVSMQEMLVLWVGVCGVTVVAAIAGYGAAYFPFSQAFKVADKIDEIDIAEYRRRGEYTKALIFRAQRALNQLSRFLYLKRLAQIALHKGVGEACGSGCSGPDGDSTQYMGTPLWGAPYVPTPREGREGTPINSLVGSTTVVRASASAASLTHSVAPDGSVHISVALGAPEPDIEGGELLRGSPSMRQGAPRPGAYVALSSALEMGAMLGDVSCAASAGEHAAQAPCIHERGARGGGAPVVPELPGLALVRGTIPAGDSSQGLSSRLSQLSGSFHAESDAEARDSRQLSREFGGRPLACDIPGEARTIGSDIPSGGRHSACDIPNGGRGSACDVPGGARLNARDAPGARNCGGTAQTAGRPHICAVQGTTKPAAHDPLTPTERVELRTSAYRHYGEAMLASEGASLRAQLDALERYDAELSTVIETRLLRDWHREYARTWGGLLRRLVALIAVGICVYRLGQALWNLTHHEWPRGPGWVAWAEARVDPRWRAWARRADPRLRVLLPYTSMTILGCIVVSNLRTFFQKIARFFVFYRPEPAAHAPAVPQLAALGESVPTTPHALLDSDGEAVGEDRSQPRAPPQGPLQTLLNDPMRKKSLEIVKWRAVIATSMCLIMAIYFAASFTQLRVWLGPAHALSPQAIVPTLSYDTFRYQFDWVFAMSATCTLFVCYIAHTHKPAAP